MQKFNMGWGLMALPWVMVALCVGIASCSRSHPDAAPADVQQQILETQNQEKPVSTPSAPVVAPSASSEAILNPSPEGLAWEAAEQDAPDNPEDVVDQPPIEEESLEEGESLPPPDDSYIHAPLRNSYIACVKNSRGMNDYLQRCGEEEYAYHEAKFRKSTQKLADSPDSPEKDRIADDLAAWWRDTDKYCAWDEKTQGQGQRLDAQSCKLNRVANHAIELEKIVDQL